MSPKTLQILPKICKFPGATQGITANLDKIPLNSMATIAWRGFAEDSENYQGTIRELVVPK